MRGSMLIHLLVDMTKPLLTETGPLHLPWRCPPASPHPFLPLLSYICIRIHLMDPLAHIVRFKKRVLSGDLPWVMEAFQKICGRLDC